jgi:hypothetical protein
MTLERALARSRCALVFVTSRFANLYLFWSSNNFFMVAFFSETKRNG